jgi:hypothetical protein
MWNKIQNAVMYWQGQFTRCCQMLAVSITALLLIGCGVSSTNGGTASGDVGGTEQTVLLTWNPMPSSIKGYNVYRGLESGGPYIRIANVVSINSYEDHGVTSGQTYYYAVTAIGLNSAESGYSNEAIAIVPEQRH